MYKPTTTCRNGAGLQRSSRHQIIFLFTIPEANLPQRQSLTIIIDAIVAAASWIVNVESMVARETGSGKPRVHRGVISSGDRYNVGCGDVYSRLSYLRTSET